MRNTQLDTWSAIQETLPERRAAVLRVIRKYPKGVALFQIADELGWTINRVSGRVTELCEMGFVKDLNSRVLNPKSGKQCIAWQYCPSLQPEKKRRTKDEEIRELKKRVYDLTLEVNRLRGY
jgi:hypothetical protein